MNCNSIIGMLGNLIELPAINFLITYDHSGIHNENWQYA